MFVKAPRRIPVQKRSQERVARILDAAAGVFSGGYEAATMEAIAEKAETSIGSIYQFFPNKLAVYTALARRYHDTFEMFFEALVEGPVFEEPWEDLLDAAIDAVAQFHENDPGFHAVWVGLHFVPEVIAEGEALNRQFAERLEAMLATKLPKLPAKKRPLAAKMVVEVMTAMTILSARRPKESREMMEETKVLFRRYLAPYSDSKVGSKR